MIEDIDSIKEKLNTHNQRINNNEDDINRLKNMADLRVTGIPYIQNENLMETFEKIAAVLNYDTSASINKPMIERVPIKDKITKAMIPSNTIILHFATQAHKQMFYTRCIQQIPAKH